MGRHLDTMVVVQCMQTGATRAKDQITEAKKVELQKFAERGVYEVVDWSEAGLNPESVMLSAKWVITNKGTVECPKPKCAPCCSRICKRHSVSWYTRAVNCQELESRHSEIVRKEIQGNALGCDGGFLVWIQRKTALHGDPQRGPRFGKPSSDSTSCTISVRDA